MFDLLHDPATTDVADFLDIAEDELAVRDDFQRPDHRWLAAKDGTAIGLATAFVRPDDRLFLTHRLTDERAFEPLLAAALDIIERRIHMTIRSNQPQRLGSALTAGFTEELWGRSYTVPFDTTLRRLEHAPSTRFDIVRVDEVDPDELFDLDTTLRADVPGSDGWRGRRMWFDDELASPTAAGQWGFDRFTTHTARPALQRRMIALGATEVDRFVRVVHGPEALSGQL